MRVRNPTDKCYKSAKTHFAYYKWQRTYVILTDLECPKFSKFNGTKIIFFGLELIAEHMLCLGVGQRAHSAKHLLAFIKLCGAVG